MTTATLALTQELIACRSVTPDDAGCQTIIANRLKNCAFQIEPLRFDDVDNLWAKFGNEEPLLVFIGHTDVVPSGPEEQWISPPFKPTIRGNYLYGRGAADMKSSIAAMVIACEQFIAQNPTPRGSIAFLLTSDEEGPATNGTAKVVELLKARQEKITYCLVGEPTCEKKLGDTLKNGRRGSLSGTLIIKGKQGHIAYPQLADNPIHRAINALNELIAIEWDQGTEHFQPTQLQISNIHAGTGATNVIPGQIEIAFNLRFAPALSATVIQSTIHEILTKHQLTFEVKWNTPSQPFFTEPNNFVSTCQSAIQEITQIKSTLSTTGGTSDGRFIAPLGCEIIEFGPCNSTIHQIDESIALADLEQLTAIYQRILEKLFTV